MPKRPTESSVVQNPLIKYAAQVGWTYISRDDATTLRKGETGLLLYDLLSQKLLHLNPKVLDQGNVGEVIKRIETVRNSIEGNEVILQFLKGEQTIYHQGQKQERAVRVIDFENPENNEYHVTDEWQFTNGKFTNRGDVVFLVNGIPVILVETKSAEKPEGITQAVQQVRRYHDETPEMVTATQIFDVTHLLGFYYGVTWNITRKGLFNWKDVEKGNFEKKVKAFFDRERILRVLHDYIRFIKKDDVLSKIILGQHQTRATEKVVARVLDPKRTSGLVWHTQGSGKTYTMITVASILIRKEELEKPTIIMLVDRNELESQLFNNLAAYGFGDVEVVESKKHLQQLLKSDYRGLLVTMIHKFDKIPADINTRKNIVVLVDEAHRTTSGDLGNYLFAALPKATFIGFTGTPIDKITYGRGTFKVFGKDDEKGYLDKYSMSESIEDGTTLPLNYSLAPNDMLVPKEQLRKEFLELAAAQGVSDIEELNKILERAVNLKNFLKSHDRVEKSAEFIARHYKRNVEPMGYKAFVVGVDREACVLYKHALDKHLPKEWSAVVYTAAHNDGKALKEFYLSADGEKKLRKAFVKRDSLPKIFIVTEKLLTGFDAPVLYAMYLDKPMRDHALLQAIARVNRPYEDEDGKKKPYGFVLDFVGIFDNLEKALSFDSDEVASVIRDIALLKQSFAQMITKQGKQYLALASGKMDDKAIEGIIEHFGDKKKRDEFFKFFTELQTLYEIISPDAFLRPYMDDYLLLSRIHQIVRNAFASQVIYDKDFLNKTALLVREKVKADGFGSTLPIYQINDKLIDELKRRHSSPVVRVVNLIRSIRKYIHDNQDEEPYLIDIGDRAERIRELFDDRQKTTEEALAELENIIKELGEAKKIRTEKNLDIQSFTAFWVLKEAGLKDHEALAKEVSQSFAQHPNWDANTEEKRQLKASVWKALINAPLVQDVKSVIDRLFKIQSEVKKRVEK